MLLRQLTYFKAVVDAESFTRAAAHEHISQSAISQQVRALERELGCELVHRTGRSFTVTPAGSCVYAAAREVADRIARMRFEVEHLQGGGRTELRVGYLSRYEGWEVASTVAAFTLRHPEVEVTARPGTHEDLYNMMLDGTIDLAFSDRRRELSDDFENIPLITRHTVIELSEANPLASRDTVAVSELVDTPCILVAPEGQRAAEREYYRDVLNFPSTFIFAASLEEAHLMVAGNRGFLPLETREAHEADHGVISRIPVVGAAGQLEREYYAFWPKRNTSWLTREFARILGELMRS